MTGVGFGVLGPLQMSVDGTLVPFGTPKQRAVLAMLVNNRNRPVGHVCRVAAGRVAAGHRHSMPQTTRAATSSNADSTPPNNGEAWPPAMTNWPSSTAAAQSYARSPSGPPIY